MKRAFIPHIVPIPEPAAIHISDLLRADIMKRDWAKTHVAGDQAEPVWLGEHKGGWR